MIKFGRRRLSIRDDKCIPCSIVESGTNGLLEITQIVPVGVVDKKQLNNKPDDGKQEHKKCTDSLL